MLPKIPKNPDISQRPGESIRALLFEAFYVSSQRYKKVC